MKNNLCKLALLLVFCCNLISPLTLFAQTHTTTYSYPDNVKGYSTMMATDAAGYETLFAGTIYNFNGTGRTAVHFWRDNGTGFPATSVFFDNPNWADLRAVSIVGDGATSGAVYTIVCSFRTTSGDNAIALINTNINGAYLGGNVIIPSIYINPTSTKYPVFPLNAIRHSNGNIYICGYWLDKPITYPTQPDFTTSKQGFILKVTPSLGLQLKLINTTYGTAPAGVFDYDIAMRVIETNNGNLLVTGSVNNCYTGGFPTTNFYNSATMNVYTGPNLEAITEDHFANRNPSFFGGEYGTGFVEDVSNNTRYIVSNMFNWHNEVPVVSPNFDNIWATGFAFTRLSSSFNIFSPSILSRGRWADFNGAWALQTLPSSTMPSPGTTQTTVVGLQNMVSSCNLHFTKDSVDPFLYDVNISLSGTTTTLTSNKWVNFHTQTGTGSFAALNCYNKLGGGITNVAWNPVFATRYNANTDVVLSAPHWEPASGSFPPRLNLKSVRADANVLTTLDCPDGYADDMCFQASIPYNVQGLGSGGGLPAPTTVTSYYGNYSYSFLFGINSFTVMTGPYGFISYAQCSPGTPHYREEATNVNEFNNEITKVYPNPAKDEVKIQLANSINSNTNISILLINIYGQVVSTLYSGKASALTNTLQLQNITPGIYMIQILGNNKMIYQDRLSIQP